LKIYEGLISVEIYAWKRLNVKLWSSEYMLLELLWACTCKHGSLGYFESFSSSNHLGRRNHEFLVPCQNQSLVVRLRYPDHNFLLGSGQFEFGGRAGLKGNNFVLIFTL